MPLTAKGRKILAAMQEEYGEEEGKRVFYASKNAGKITGVDSMQIRDSLTLEFDDAAFERNTEGKLKFMDGGYLRAKPRIARTGIQIYRGKECGNDSLEKVRVYRPEDSVFSPSAVDSYTHLPITVEHPGTVVDASNWKQFAVGETGDEVLREGETVRVPMMLRDAAAIRTVLDEGKRQISVGYSCDLEWVDGITEDGQKYDAVQKNIRGNHVAIVSTARGGPELKFGDKGDDAMDLKTITVDGIACQMTDTAAALVLKLQDQFENFKKKKKKEEEESEDAVSVLKKDVAAKDAAIAVKDKEITDLQVKLKDALSPVRLDQCVRDRAAVIDKACKIAGKQIKTDGITDADIKREIVNGKLGDTAKGWDDNQVSAAFDAITVTATTSTLTDAVRVFNRAGNAPFGHPSGSQDPRDQAYFDSVKELENAWRPKPAAQ
jgi:uncharacterized protein